VFKEYDIVEAETDNIVWSGLGSRKLAREMRRELILDGSYPPTKIKQRTYTLIEEKYIR
jgi:hypothetical protein